MDENGEVKSFHLISSIEDEGVPLILQQWKTLTEWVYKEVGGFENVAGAMIEGLSFGSVGSGKDFLAGLQWFFRARMQEEYGIFLGTCPVSMWRSRVLNKLEQREAKKLGSEGVKVMVFDKLPEPVKAEFEQYVYTHRDRINAAKDRKIKAGSKSSKYLSARWDLTDAYFIARHCLQLSIGK